MATAINAPTAPDHLSPAYQKKWLATYSARLTQAKVDFPDNESAQRTTALKAANALLAVPAPTSAAEIDKLDEWQVIDRKTIVVKGISTRVCVTADGRKYSFEIPAAK
jgi:hypothetical protein